MSHALHHKLQLSVRSGRVFSQIKIHDDETFLLYWNGLLSPYNLKAI